MAHINTINNEDNNFLFDTLEWLNNQKNVAIKTAIEKWPDDYKFIAESALWFEQITDAIRNHPPEDNVRRVIVKENIHGDAVGVDYEYYPKEDPLMGKWLFALLRLTSKTTILSKLLRFSQNIYRLSQNPHFWIIHVIMSSSRMNDIIRKEMADNYGTFNSVLFCRLFVQT